MKKRAVHYINNFFAGIGGEEMAHIPSEKREGVIGPGMALQAAFGDDVEIVATLICGDNYFGENTEQAVGQLLSWVKEANADIFIAGPAFNAGRYGFACGSIVKAVQDNLGIPAFTAMYEENPGVDAFRKDMYILKTNNSATGMRKAVPSMIKFAKKLLNHEEILGPSEEDYFERGIRVNYFHEKRGSERAVEMLLQKVAGNNPVTEYPLPKIDRVEPVSPVTDMAHTKIAIVTSGGIVPVGNPDHIESSSASKYGIYSIAGMERMSKDDFTSVHGGYDRQFVLEDPNLVVPLDALRELEKENVIGELADYFMTTTGTGTSTGNAKRFGEDIAKKLLEDKVGAVILTST